MKAHKFAGSKSNTQTQRRIDFWFGVSFHSNLYHCSGLCDLLNMLMANASKHAKQYDSKFRTQNAVSTHPALLYNKCVDVIDVKHLDI